MPYNFEYPIDDNTLFILLALRYQGCIKRENINYVYDRLVNYDYTYLKHNNNREAVTSIREKGFDWITNEFGLAEADDKDGEPILQIKNKEKLEIFLYYYFSEFRIYEDYYRTVEEHKEKLIEFIEKEFKGKRCEELGKKFTYKFTPDEQYKMIQYIGYLIHHNIFAEPIDEREMFTFNNGERGYKKAVRMRFVDGYNIEKFKCGRKEKGKFYILANDNNVYFSQTGAALAIYDVDLLALLRECIAKDLDKITVETFRKVRAKVAKNHKNLSDARIRRYFSMLNRHLKDLTLLSEREFIYNEHHDGVWTVDLE